MGSVADDAYSPTQRIARPPAVSPRLDPECAAHGRQCEASTPAHRRTSPAKRAIDVCLALFALALLSPLIVAIALLVWVTDAGPVFYHRDMIGWQGVPFRMWKFRTMVPGAEDLLLGNPQLYDAYQASGFKLSHDPRVTRIGRFLRKHSLDELPQLWNVLIGDMSLVGPRAIHWSERSLFGDFAAERERIRPGVTGLWQVSGRSNTSYQERIRLDREYVERHTMWMDLRILLRTVAVVFTGTGAC